jgi:hypothetical protein
MEALATKIRTADAPGGDRQLFGRQVCRGKGEHWCLRFMMPFLRFG